MHNFFTMTFGWDLEAELPYSSELRWSVDYLPEVTDWKGNYLIRTSTDWTLPINGWQDFKIPVFEIYNNRPPADAYRSTFSATAGL